ncbi:PTS transporter subunit EIIC [Streptomyces sp. NPDC003077]|uniref:PTS transporter subunit EIIC n=1 Tax=Streptomyces sp. NPDC003077 TaxID=3154443 RepID=UPI0033A6AF43
MSAAPHRDTAAAILPLVGGAENVVGVTHCMTRLRLGIRDRSLVQDEALQALPAVLAVIEDDTYQIVLGPGTAARVTPEFIRLVAEEHAATSPPSPAPEPHADDPPEPGPEAEPPPSTPSPPPRPPTRKPSVTGPGPDDPATTCPAHSATGPAPTGPPPPPKGTPTPEAAALKARRDARNATPVKIFLRRIADIFVPLIPALVGCGIIAGVNGLLMNFGWLPSAVPALTAVSSGFMTLIAVFVGYNTAKEFGGTPVLGGAVAAVIVFPGIAQISVFGRELVPGQGGVLGALGAAALAARIERWCRGWVPEAVDVLVTPTLTVLIPGLLTVSVLMFAAGEVSAALGTAFERLLAGGGAAAGFVLGALFLPLVMLGLHQALVPLHATLIEEQGYTVLLPLLAMAGAGQIGAALAVYLRVPRNGPLRRTIRSALPAAFLGVGEPLVYGVSLPLGRPFVTACVGGAFGGGFVGLFHQLGDTVGATAIGPSGWALFPLVRGNHGPATTLTVYALGLLVGYLTGFLATYFFGLSRRKWCELNTKAEHHMPRGAGDVTGSAGSRSATASRTPNRSVPRRHGPRPAVLGAVLGHVDVARRRSTSRV